MLTQHILFTSHSICDRSWELRSTKVADASNIIEILMRSRELSQNFFDISLKNTMPDPFIFKDMKQIIRKLTEAILKKRPIAILGDYDVDGISSTALFIKFLKHVNATYSYYIPNRFTDGYGFNTNVLDKFRDSLIVAVDCGSSALNELQYAYENGIDLVVIDHHDMNSIPENSVIANPHRPDESNNYRYLCAAGLSFICIVGINRELRNSNFYITIQEPKIVDYLDIVTLATICDVVPLIGLNRVFVQRGLKVIAEKKNIGISAIMKFSQTDHITAESIGFFLGPRLNAAGRLASADISLELLICDNASIAHQLAKQLDSLNKERQDLDQMILSEAEAMINQSSKIICVAKADWHSGVIGIVAGRLKEKFGKPAIVITGNDGGLWRASCRSTKNIDISQIIQRGIKAGIIDHGGGHPAAGGFSIEQEKIDSLKYFLEKQDICLEKEPFIADCIVENPSLQLVQNMQLLEPFGAANEYPKFIVRDMLLINFQIVKELHLSAIFQTKNGQKIKTISFKSAGSALHKAFEQNIGHRFDLLGTLSINHWNGNSSINLQIYDAILR